MSASTVTPVAYDVLVVGAGPSGLTTAISAARHGASVLVVDRHRGTSVFPKATGVRPRSMEILRTWGLEERFRASHQDVRVAMAISMSLVDPHQQEVSLGAPEPEVLAQVSPSSFAVSAQDELEPVLLDHLLSIGATVRFETELVDLLPDDDGQVARLQGVGAGPGSSYDVHARYVVGADGAESNVRRLAGIGVRHLGTEGNHLAMLFRADLAERIIGRRYALHMVTTPTGPAIFVPSGVRSLGARPGVAPGAGRDRSSPGPMPAPSRRSATDAGMPDLDVELLGVFPWSFGAAVATAMRAGRRLPRGRRRPPDHAQRRDRHEHRDRRRPQPRLEAGLGGPWLGRRGTAGQLRRGALPGGAGQRAGLPARPRGPTPPETSARTSVSCTRRPRFFGTAQRQRHLLASRASTGSPAPFRGRARPTPGFSRADTASPPWTCSTDGSPSSPAAAVDRSSAIRDLAAVDAPAAVVTVGRDVSDTWCELERAYRLGETDAVLVRPDGHIAWRSSASTADLRTALRTALGRAPVTTPSLV